MSSGSGFSFFLLCFSLLPCGSQNQHLHRQQRLILMIRRDLLIYPPSVKAGTTGFESAYGAQTTHWPPMAHAPVWTRFVGGDGMGPCVHALTFFVA